MKQGKFKIISNEEIMPSTCLMWIEAPEIAGGSQPGQFVLMRVDDNYDPLLRRPFSIHRLGENGELAFLFGTWGRGTLSLAAKAAGEQVDLLGPLGRGFDVQPDARNLLLVGGGMGVAPLVDLSERSIASGRSITLLLGGTSADHLYPSRLLPPEVELVLATDDGSAGHNGLITELVGEYADWADQVFACGPEPMYRSLATALGDHVARKSVQVLLEANMACGVGACLGCAVETRRGYKICCKDGPRFELRELL
jgi:dihydroorotate dehydrogenase electron transfer subunit